MVVSVDQSTTDSWLKPVMTTGLDNMHIDRLFANPSPWLDFDLRHCGLTGTCTTYQWISSFRNSRTQLVLVEGQSSEKVRVAGGVRILHNGHYVNGIFQKQIVPEPLTVLLVHALSA